MYSLTGKGYSVLNFMHKSSSKLKYNITVKTQYDKIQLSLK